MCDGERQDVVRFQAVGLHGARCAVHAVGRGRGQAQEAGAAVTLQGGAAWRAHGQSWRGARGRQYPYRKACGLGGTRLAAPPAGHCTYVRVSLHVCVRLLQTASREETLRTVCLCVIVPGEKESNSAFVYGLAAAAFMQEVEALLAALRADQEPREVLGVADIPAGDCHPCQNNPVVRAHAAVMRRAHAHAHTRRLGTMQCTPSDVHPSAAASLAMLPASYRHPLPHHL